MPDDPTDRPDPAPAAPRRMRFEPAAALIAGPLRKAAAARGFALARLLTHWDEVAGPELARLCRPLRISYARKGFGATLVLESPGAAAPLVQMRLEGLRARINAAHGHAAIARIQLVQGGLGVVPGMAEAPAPFARGPALPRSDNLAQPSAAALDRARGVVAAMCRDVADDDLRAALERLALNVLGRRRAAPATDGKEQA